MTTELKYIIESLLFVADGPLPIERLKAVIGTAETPALRQAIAELKNEYEARGGGFFLEEVAGGFQLRTRPEFTEHIRRLVRPAPVRLSKAALETLAIIAYKQPAIRTDVEIIRGVDCGGVMRMLLERRMIRVLGRKEIPGRPLLYGTTRQFLEVFGLKDLKELPTPKEIEAFGRTLTDSDGPLFDLEAPDEGMDAAQRADAETGGHGDAQTDTQSDAPLEGRAPARPSQPEPDEGMDAENEQTNSGMKPET